MTKLLLLLLLTFQNLILHASSEEDTYDYFLEEEREKSLKILEDLENNQGSLSIHSRSSSVRILPLGDSITFGMSIADQYDPDNYRHSYRNYLWYKLKDAGFSVNFVGRRNTGWDVIPSFDGNNEGWPGLKTYDIDDKMSSILSASNPDIILLHIGTNDQSSNVSGLNSILNKIDDYESNNHHITVVLAKILGSTDEDHPGRNAIFASYNNNLVDLANSRKNNGDDIVIVDMYRGAGIHYDNRDMSDYLHPTNSGYRKMANVWFNALEDILITSPVIPPKPSNFYATSVTHNSVKLSWSDNSDNEDRFKIYHNNTRIATLDADTTQYTVNNLNPNTTYTFQIVAGNGEGNSEIVQVTLRTKDDYAWLPAIYHVILN